MAKKPEIKPGPVSSKDGLLERFIPPVLTAVSIIIVAALLALLSSAINSKKSASVKIVSNTESNFITIKDPASNRSYKVPIEPASASAQAAEGGAQQPAVRQAQSAEGVKNFNRLYKAVKLKDDIQRIDYDEARKLYDSGKAVFIDARGDEAYNSAHIKGAVSLPPAFTPEMLEKHKQAFKNKVLVTYCSGTGCHLSDKTAYRLFDNGYDHVVIFFGGWARWAEHNAPVVQGGK